MPPVAAAEGGPAGLIDHGRTGLLCAADPDALASAVLDLAGSPRMREHLGTLARSAVAGRTWEAALARLAEGYRHTLAPAPAAGRRAA